jgi:PAS domain S-box-containing protein
MEFSHQRIALAFAASAVGIVVTWLTTNPLGLLAPTAAVFLFAQGRTVLLLHAASAIGLVGALFVAAAHTGAMHDLAMTSVAFFALALCIGAVVAAGASSPSGDAKPVAIPNTTRKEAPHYPVVGPSLHEKSAPRHSPLVAISAQDDNAAALLVAVSFWGGTRFHIRYWRRQPDGSYRWVESRSEPLRELSGTRLWSGVTADIDDQRPAQAPPTKIASNPSSDDEAVWAAKIVENLLGNAWAFDAAGRPTYLTPLAQTFVAVTLEEFQAAVDEGYTFFKRTAHPDDYDRVSAAWRHSLHTGDPFFLDRRIRRASGIHEWNRTGFVPTRDRQGRITGWYGATIDLDSHRIAEAELRNRERELSHLVAMVPSHIWRLSRDGEPIFFNQRMVDFLGFDVPDTDKPGMSRLEAVIATIHPDDAAMFRDTINRCLVAGESFTMRYRMRRADGAYRWMSSRAEPLRNQDGTIAQWYSVSIDIEDEARARQAEGALRETSDKLAKATQAASLAELSASIAHEVNQPLAAIVANSHACQRWLSAEPANVERAKITVERIIRDANSAADVVGRIRALFRQSVKSREGGKLPSVIAEAYDLMADEASRQRVRIDIDVESNLPLVPFDRVQIQQVLVNLIRNGIDAMDATADDRVVEVCARRAGDVVRTEISDRGRGVEFPDKIFEPFFTTKENGMGMGLAVCRSIIESHGGRLWAEKNEPHGARFIFTLPLEVKTAH